jgi:hypothetical protein
VVTEGVESITRSVGAVIVAAEPLKDLIPSMRDVVAVIRGLPAAIDTSVENAVQRAMAAYKPQPKK